MSKQSNVEQTKANLPRPEDPPVTSDWNSLDTSTTNVGSGRVESHAGTGPQSTTGQGSGPATSREGLEKVGRQGVENLDGPPKDAKY